MTSERWMVQRRAWLTGAAAGAAVLAAGCGSSSIESALTPARFVAFGDSAVDVGQRGATYSVNDGSLNNWLMHLASRYNLSVRTEAAGLAAGSISYGRGQARVTAKPDAAGNAATLTVREQIDAFLANGGRFGTNDVVILGAGLSDVVAELARMQAGQQTEAQMTTAIRAAGTALADQARRLVTAGARYVVMVGPYNLGLTPWGRQQGNRAGVWTSAAAAFNEAFLVATVDMGANVLYIDAPYFYNLALSNPGFYGISNVSEAVCNSVDAGAGIGTGTGQVNSVLCTTGTLINSNYANYFWADRLHANPRVQREMGNYAFDRLRARW
jgi:outer membrane lipase/esterase